MLFQFVLADILLQLVQVFAGEGMLNCGIDWSVSRGLRGNGAVVCVAGRF